VRSSEERKRMIQIGKKILQGVEELVNSLPKVTFLLTFHIVPFYWFFYFRHITSNHLRPYSVTDSGAHKFLTPQPPLGKNYGSLSNGRNAWGVLTL
jgi:hypothetical protein